MNSISLDDFSGILTILQQLGTIGALFYGIVFLYNQSRTLKTSRDAFRLSNWKEITALIRQDSDVRDRMNACLKQLDRGGNIDVQALVQRHATGKRIYLSEELRDFRDVARHYEYIGASVRLRYLPADLLNEVIPFPDEFWERTEEIRNFIKMNWFGLGDSLDAFLSNFEWMRTEWHRRR